MMMLRFLSLLRVKSWIKNGFLILPAIFSLHLMNGAQMTRLGIGIIIFSLACSVIYILNDVHDAPNDAIHPRKKFRPIASGEITPTMALLVAFFLCGFVVALFYLSKIDALFLYLVGVYLSINLLYTFWLKTLPIIELLIVSMNFVIRVLAGCAVLDVSPSQWILVVTFFVSFLLVVIKRKSEIVQLSDNAINHRTVLGFYTTGFLNVLIYISATITLMGYLLYSIDPHVVKSLGSGYIMYSSLFVLMGIVRLIQISEQGLYEGEGDPTTILFKDRFLQVTLVLWLIYLIAIIYAV